MTQPDPLDEQLALLEELRADLSEWVLVVLDACRYDAFEHLVGGSMPVRSVGTNTQAWVREGWPGEYPDTVYVSSVPFIAREEVKGYAGEDHFADVVLVEHDNHLGTVPPDVVTQAALRHRDVDRLVVHFVQPHAPYIGEPRLIERDAIPGTMRAGVERQGTLGAVRKRVEAGELDLEAVRAAYLGNLRLAWRDGVAPLLEAFNDRVVAITADHGECLGEHKIGHNVDCTHVRTVPWLDVVPWAGGR